MSWAEGGNVLPEQATVGRLYSQISITARTGQQNGFPIPPKIMRFQQVFRFQNGTKSQNLENFCEPKILKYVVQLNQAFSYK